MDMEGGEQAEASFSSGAACDRGEFGAEGTPGALSTEEQRRRDFIISSFSFQTDTSIAGCG